MHLRHWRGPPENRRCCRRGVQSHRGQSQARLLGKDYPNPVCHSRAEDRRRRVLCRDVDSSRLHAGRFVGRIDESRAAFLTGAEGIEKTLRAWPAQNRALFSEITAVEAELDEIFPYVRNLFHALRGNPRQIKRFLNILSLRRRLAKANNLAIHLHLLIKLAVLEYAWKDFFENIIDTVDPLTGSCELFQAIAYDGLNPMPPMFCYLKPYF